MIPGDRCDLTNGFKPDSGLVNLNEVCKVGDDRELVVDELKPVETVCDHNLYVI